MVTSEKSQGIGIIGSSGTSEATTNVVHVFSWPRLRRFSTSWMPIAGLDGSILPNRGLLKFNQYSRGGLKSELELYF